jgi:hypothetical protein
MMADREDRAGECFLRDPPLYFGERGCKLRVLFSDVVLEGCSWLGGNDNSNRRKRAEECGCGTRQ